jgi:sec-independent protein translocase protein TatA
MTTLAWMIGWTEVAVIAVVALLIFGRRLPEVGRSLGQGMVEFKKGLRGGKDDAKDAGAGADEGNRSGQNKDVAG